MKNLGIVFVVLLLVTGAVLGFLKSRADGTKFEKLVLPGL
jgi:UPF0716 family protein affecting phage T7 exclusion